MKRPSPSTGISITGGNLRIGVTIPQAGARISELVRAAAPEATADPLTFLILGRTPAGTDRGAFVVADPRPGASIQEADYTLHGQFVDSGEDYTSPAAGDLDSYARGMAADVPAVIVLFW